MCTRFYIEPETEELKEILGRVQRSHLSMQFVKAGHAVKTSGEVRPADVAPVVAPDQAGRRAVFPMRWGFTLPGRSPVLNARSETAAEKPLFRDAWMRRRCVIPASWYFEWEHLKDPSGGTKTGARYMIQPQDSTLTWLCGLYRFEDGLPVFTVLTREPSEELRRIHDRMPLILPEELIGEWIRPGADPATFLPHALTRMYAERG